MRLPRGPAPGVPGVLGITGDERLWVAAKWDLVRRSQMAADKATNDWHRIGDEIDDYMCRAGITDVVQRDRVKGESLSLRDALETGKWHAANAQRHIDDVLLYLRLKELKLI
jgi:hypothetical protein